MSSNRIQQALRDHDLRNKIVSERDRKWLSNAKRTVDDGGSPISSRFKSIRTPLVMNWLVGDDKFVRAARAGTAVLMSCYSVTPPSTGQLIIRLYQTTAESGQTVIGTLYCPSGTRIFEQVVALDILAGAWLSTDIQSSGSAAGVSLSLTINVG